MLSWVINFVPSLQCFSNVSATPHYLTLLLQCLDLVLLPPQCDTCQHLAVLANTWIVYGSACIGAYLNIGVVNYLASAQSGNIPREDTDHAAHVFSIQSINIHLFTFEDLWEICPTKNFFSFMEIYSFDSFCLQRHILHCVNHFIKYFENHTFLNIYRSGINVAVSGSTIAIFSDKMLEYAFFCHFYARRRGRYWLTWMLNVMWIISDCNVRALIAATGSKSNLGGTHWCSC